MLVDHDCPVLEEIQTYKVKPIHPEWLSRFPLDVHVYCLRLEIPRVGPQIALKRNLHLLCGGEAP